MNTLRCPICKKMYQFNGLPPKYCPECYLKDEAQYQLVRALVKERPGINIMEASKATGVSQGRIMKYLREERLEAVPNSTSFLTCVACGKMINTGLYCPDCKRRYSESTPHEAYSEAELNKSIFNTENKVHTRSNTPS